MGTGRRARTLRLSLAALAAAGLILAMGSLLAPPALAHALRTASDPAPGATLQSPPSQIVITFSERPDLRSSLIQVLDTSGKQWASGAPQAVAGQPATVVRLPVTQTLPKGVYTVNWKTISSVDGHLATGAFSFGVQVAPTGANASSSGVASSSRPSVLAAGSRWVYLYGLIGLLGLAFSVLVVLPANAEPSAARRLRTALAASWILAVAGALGIAAASASEAGIALRKVASSTIGHALGLRLIPLAITGIALLLARRARPALWLAAAATLAAMLADVLKSHAAAAASWVWFRVAVQLIHIAAAGVWIGGLAGLLLCLGPLGAGARGPAARRFSFWALIAFAVVGVTGLARALDEVGSWHGLLHTGFGQLIVVKSALFGVLGLLGALNRFRSTAAAADQPGRLRRVGRMELVAMAVVLAATAVLQNLNPPRSAAAPAANPTAVAPLVVNTSDFAQLYHLRLTISPGTPGFNDFALRVSDFSTGKLVLANAVSLGFHAVNNPTVGDSTLALVRQPSGTYDAKAANLSLLGRWSVTILVQNGDKTVDLPVDIVTQSPPQPTKSQAFAGSPTVYTVTLAGASRDQLQIYTDPINLGKSEFHATFLDPAGAEVPMQDTLAVQDFSPGGAVGPVLSHHQLSAGHFAADGPGTPGTYTFSVVGVTADGTALGATITVPVRR